MFRADLLDHSFPMVGLCQFSDALQLFGVMKEATRDLQRGDAGSSPFAPAGNRVLAYPADLERNQDRAGSTRALAITNDPGAL